MNFWACSNQGRCFACAHIPSSLITVHQRKGWRSSGGWWISLRKMFMHQTYQTLSWPTPPFGCSPKWLNDIYIYIYKCVCIHNHRQMVDWVNLWWTKPWRTWRRFRSSRKGLITNTGNSSSSHSHGSGKWVAGSGGWTQFSDAPVATISCLSKQARRRNTDLPMLRKISSSSTPKIDWIKWSSRSSSTPFFLRLFFLQVKSGSPLKANQQTIKTY